MRMMLMAARMGAIFWTRFLAGTQFQSIMGQSQTNQHRRMRTDAADKKFPFHVNGRRDTLPLEV
jgi:hypothetical protein